MLPVWVSQPYIKELYRFMYCPSTQYDLIQVSPSKQNAEDPIALERNHAQRAKLINIACGYRTSDPAELQIRLVTEGGVVLHIQGILSSG